MRIERKRKSLGSHIDIVESSGRRLRSYQENGSEENCD